MYGGFVSKEVIGFLTFIFVGIILIFQQEANITVGKLKCQGRGNPREDDSMSTTCSNLKQSGETKDGFYLTQEESADSVAASYCKMSKPGIKK